jgi:antitoxin component of MazEF toxin-antitoxin module
MTLVVKSIQENTIMLPEWLMKRLDLSEGEEVKPSIEGQTLHLTPLDQFLALRGALREDDAFDEAMAYLDRAWQTWTQPTSV